MELIIKHAGYQDIQVPNDTSILNIVVDKGVNASLMMTYNELDAPLPMSIKVMEEGSLTLLMKKAIPHPLTLTLHAMVHKDANVTLAFLDMERGETQVQASVQLCEQGAQALIQSACVVFDKKVFDIECIHMQPHTKGIMKHYAVVGDAGVYRMQACGKIVKGAYQSASHQTTRVLTMSEEHNSEVIPLLLIDENDVAASHATTLGQPDENQLYYLQTRGLTRAQALGLLSVGYIMPISELFEDEEVNKQLKNEIEMKVGLHA